MPVTRRGSCSPHRIGGGNHPPVRAARRHVGAFLISGVALIAAPTVLAQSGGTYDLHWNTAAAGGAGMSGAGGYTLIGTIGQPIAGPAVPMTNGPSALVSGFWSVHANDVIFRSGFQ